jgi:hypothetical protein
VYHPTRDILVSEVGGSDRIGFRATRIKMEDTELLKAMLNEMNAIKETLEKQIGSLVSIMEAAKNTDRDEMKQEIRGDLGHIKEIIKYNLLR